MSASGLRLHDHSAVGQGGPAVGTLRDLISGDDATFATSTGAWANHGATVFSRDTTAAYHATGFAASLKARTTTVGQYVDLAIAGTFKSGQRYDALVWLKVEETSFSSDELTLELGLHGTDVVTTAQSLFGSSGFVGSAGYFAPLWITWVPSADRTGVTLRLGRTTGSSTVTAHVAYARVASIGNASDPGLGAVANPATSGAQSRVALSGGLGLGDGGPRVGFNFQGHLSLTSADFSGELDVNQETVEVYAQHTAANLAGNGKGFHVVVGEDFIGLRVSEKDFSTIQVYEDSGGFVDVELVDQGSRHWKHVAADGGAAIPSLGRLPIYSAAPSSPTEGDAYYDSTLHKSRTWNGSSWNNHW